MAVKGFKESNDLQIPLLIPCNWGTVLSALWQMTGSLLSGDQKFKKVPGWGQG